MNHMFGFTGTPIFALNASARSKFPTLRTTEQIFGKKLHTYTIVDAIRDGNVLPFRIDYLNTVKAIDDVEDDKEVYDIERENALLDDRRIEENVKYTLEHFDQKTKRNEKGYSLSKLLNIEDVAKSKYKSRLTNSKEEHQNIITTGFNSIFAVASIKAAKKYYLEFQRQQQKIPPARRLKIATIFSWSPNESLDGIYEENNESTEKLDKNSRDFLESAIEDYN